MKNVLGKVKTHILYSVTIFFENDAVYAAKFGGVGGAKMTSQYGAYDLQAG